MIERDPVLVLPLASTEQHGPHLPLSTDLDIGLGIVADAFGRLPEDFPAYSLPPVAVGASLEHARFPGTVSLHSDLLARVIHAQGAALARHGLRRLVLYSSHGGNRAAIDAAGLELRDECGLLVVKSSHFAVPPPGDVDLPSSEWRHGLHGGAVETSMMLHLRSDLVRLDHVPARRSLGPDLEEGMKRLGPESEASFSWMAGDLSASGVTGDPALASAETGARLVEHYGRALAETIEDARSFPLERLS